MITIIGAGFSADDLTLKGLKAINNADKIIIKTALTDTYNYFKENNIKVESLDFLNKKARNSNEFNELIFQYFKEINKQFKNIVYVVNGSGIDDVSAIKLNENFETKIILGVDYSAIALKNNPSSNFTILSANSFLNLKVLNIDKRYPLIIKNIDNNSIANNIKLWLIKIYGDQYNCYFIDNENYKKIIISEIDKQTSFGYNSMLLVLPTKLVDRKAFDFSDILEIMYILRGENGCKWDRAQTHESIKINMVEEAYELIDAINNKNANEMIEETGDVLLQAVFHSVIGEQSNEYNVYDVFNNLCNKLISRHTHIFGNEIANTGEQALNNWDKAKAKEKKYKNYSDKINRIPKNFPALLYAQKMQKTAKKAGFDWDNVDGAIEKMQEELNELKNATDDEKMLEAGDLLFSVVNVVRFFDVDSETALKQSSKKFYDRFSLLEEMIEKDNLNINECNLETLEKYYQKAKEQLLCK